jgi:hypothetical protein
MTTIKSSRIWAEYVAHIGKRGYSHKVSMGSLKERHNQEDPG